MKSKTKKIIGISVLLVVFATVLLVVIVAKLKKSEKTEDFEIWKEKPFVYSSSKEETTYKSYKEAFAKTIQTKIYELSGKQNAKINSAFVDEKQNPTAVISYTNESGKLCLIILKYINGEYYALEREPDFDSISADNDLYIYEDSDLISERSGINADVGKQVIFDLYQNDYCAVKNNNYEKCTKEKMDKTVKEYKSNAKSYVLFSKKAVSENVIDYLNKALDYSFEKE